MNAFGEYPATVQYWQSQARLNKQELLRKQAEVNVQIDKVRYLEKTALRACIVCLVFGASVGALIQRLIA